MLAALDSGGDPDLLGLPGTSSEEVVSAQDDENVTVAATAKEGASSKTKSFEFERVYNPGDSQNNVFADVGPLLTSLVDGYVSSLFLFSNYFDNVSSNKSRFCNNIEIGTLISKRLSVENKGKFSQLTREDFVTIAKLSH